VAFGIARLVLDQYRPDDGSDTHLWLFPQILAIAKRWLAECVTCKDDTFPQLLLLIQKAHKAAEKVSRAITASNPGERRVRAVLRESESVGSTEKVSFDTTKGRWPTQADKCHINFVPYDSNWEAKFAQAIEDLVEVKAYVKNQNLGFKIPYTYEGRRRDFVPDFILRVDDGHGMNDLLNLVVEISGQDLQDKQAKVDTATKLWVPAVNAEGTLGRWDFLEITDPREAKALLRGFLGAREEGGVNKP
jgi:type III restriction enzyme